MLATLLFPVVTLAGKVRVRFCKISSPIRGRWPFSPMIGEY
jgi:hypothetical protein